MKFKNFTPEECDLRFVVRFDLVLGIFQGCQVSINDQGGLENPFKTKNLIFNFYPWGGGIWDLEWDLRFGVGFDLVLGISQGCQVSINDQGGLRNPFKTKNLILKFLPMRSEI